MKKILLLVFAAMLCVGSASATSDELPTDSDAIVTNSFGDNWFVQAGADMILLFPVHHSVKDVFPNGKSFGLSLTVGKWFTPEFGGKFKVNWNNVFFRDDYNIWYFPYKMKNGSHHTGGFITFSGDMQFNMHNLFGVYKPDRKWNLIVSPRAGGWIVVRDGKGGPVLGLGINNTYRLNNKWQLFADVNYSFVTSINGVSSGTDHGGNSYAEINVGVEMSLSKNNTFHKASENVAHSDNAVQLNSFWDNWFAQAGLGMSLQNPYGTNFANVFPRGSTLGINLGIGKWFSPEVAVRGGINWQNVIIRNHHADHLAAIDDPECKLDKRGFYSLYADLFFNLHNIIAGYSADRKWNAIVYPRMGIATNFSSSFSECPTLGIGTEHTYAINDKIKLFADVSYQILTSGFHDTKYKTPDFGISSNGWFDINVGVQYELGKKSTWRRVNRLVN